MGDTIALIIVMVALLTIVIFLLGAIAMVTLLYKLSNNDNDVDNYCVNEPLTASISELLHNKENTAKKKKDDEDDSFFD